MGKICLKCNTLNGDNDKFCHACGDSLFGQEKRVPLEEQDSNSKLYNSLENIGNKGFKIQLVAFVVVIIIGIIIAGSALDLDFIVIVVLSLVGILISYLFNKFRNKIFYNAVKKRKNNK